MRTTKTSHVGGEWAESGYRTVVAAIVRDYPDDPQVLIETIAETPDEAIAKYMEGKPQGWLTLQRWHDVGCMDIVIEIPEQPIPAKAKTTANDRPVIPADIRIHTPPPTSSDDNA